MGLKPRNKRSIAAELRAFALSLPEATEDHPWGETVAKVRKKVFVFLGRDMRPDGSYGFSVKLPRSGGLVLGLAFANPTGYGLGAHGWVSVTLTPGEMPPTGVLFEWIEESYRAVAPKKLAALLET